MAKRGRPKKAESRDQAVAVRLTEAERFLLTELRKREPDLPTEAEMFRRLLRGRGGKGTARE